MKRLDYLDLLRFLAGIAVVCTHVFNVGIPWGSYPFSLGWVFVEFFFIVTGYFTTEHFKRTGFDAPLDARMGRSLEYTKRKFARIFPYSTIVIVAEYTFANLGLLPQGLWKFITGFQNMLFEICYLSCATTHGASAATVWYVSAMFLVFPVFGLLLQTKNRNILTWVSFILPVLYYCYFGVSVHREYPHDLARAFCCMLIGTCISLSMDKIKQVCERVQSKLVLTLIEVACFAFTMVAAYRNSFGAMNLCLVAFIVSLGILFSGMSYTSSVRSSVMRWLGRLSLPMFLWNWTIASGIRTLAPSLPDAQKIGWYFALCLIVPLITLVLVERIQDALARMKAAGART